MDEIRFTTHAPPASLASAVQEMWALDDAGRLHCGLPKPFVEIVISLGGIHWWRSAPQMPEFRYATAWITPVQSGPRYARAQGRRRLVGARLQPWAARAWLGPLPDGDGSPPPCLSDYLGPAAHALRHDLMSAPSQCNLFDRFGSWLERQAALRAAQPVAAPPPEAETTQAQAQALALASQATPRHHRRVFAGQSGLAPKRWLLLRRLDAVLRDPRLADPGYSLALLAAEHGFADQAHLTREMKRFTGATPGTFRSRGTHYPPHMLPAK